jgi:hypothetical protein
MESLCQQCCGAGLAFLCPDYEEFKLSDNKRVFATINGSPDVLVL